MLNNPIRFVDLNTTDLATDDELGTVNTDLQNFKSFITTEVDALEANLASHGHSQYAPTLHMHDYAATNHTHSFAAVNHNHSTDDIPGLTGWLNNFWSSSEVNGRRRATIVVDGIPHFFINSDGRFRNWTWKTSYIEVQVDSSLYGVSVFASDISLKKNVEYADLGGQCLAEIKQIPLCSYDWKSSDVHVPVGLIAQDLQDINPRWVNVLSDEKLCVEPLSLSVSIIGTVQALIDRVETLEAELATLKNQQANHES